MDFFQLVDSAITNVKGSLWPIFAPELILCLTIFALLLAKTLPVVRAIPSYLLVIIGSLLALYMAIPAGFTLDSIGRTEIFSGMLVHDSFSVFVRALLMVFAALFAIFTWLSGVPDPDDGADFYTLVLGATVGMCLMTSANHLLVIFLAVEMASVPSYALAASMRGNRKASEAALKYAIYGAGAAGVMLYGISLLAGLLGSAHLPTMATLLSEQLPGFSGSEKMVLALAGLMLGVGLAFKLSAVPFHFWCPDVFEGASAEVCAFLSIASKAAALALAVRVVTGLGTLPPEATELISPSALTEPNSPVAEATLLVSDPPTLVAAGSNDAELELTGGDADALAPVRQFAALLIAFLAAITCTFGNLAAYGQTNIKRLLAYSTIAHAGYMLLPIPAALVLYGVDRSAAQDAISSMALYMAIYLFMNLGAFAIVAFLRNDLGTEEIDDYAGLIRSRPGIVVCIGIIFFSLVGIPPLAGFAGKFAIFATLANGYQLSGRTFLMLLLIIGGLNTVISLFYYLRVVKVMAIDPEPAEPRNATWSLISLSGAFVVLNAAALILLFLQWNGLNEWTKAATSQLF